MKRKSRKDLSIVNTNDKDTCSDWPLIEKPVGSVTYEHCLVERFYQDIFMGTAERNYYVDTYHELCLCVHFNRRIPGKYEFIPDYQFFVTKKRMCLDIYWNLGNISDEGMILEKYDNLESAKSSRYYSDFCDLKQKIEEGIEFKKNHVWDPFKYGNGSCFQSSDKVYSIYEYPNASQKEFVQFYWNTNTKQWEKMSISSVQLSDLVRFFKDFEELDKRELHLRIWLPITVCAVAETGQYHILFKDAEEFNRSMNEDRY